MEKANINYFFFFNILASSAVMYASLTAGASFLALNLFGTVTDSEFFIKFKEIFPKEILYRKKKVGFEAPDNEWLKKGYYLILYFLI